MRYRRSPYTARRNPEDISVEGYFVAGTPHGFEFTTDDKPLCVVCGAPLKHVFVTDRGLMGGDCLATLTGDDSSRAVLRRLKRFEGYKCRMEVRKLPEGSLFFKITQGGSTPFIGSLRGGPATAVLGWGLSNEKCRVIPT